MALSAGNHVAAFAGPVTALPQYIIVAKMGLINTLWSVILPAVGLPLGLFLMRNFMTQIPDGMLEAARILTAREPGVSLLRLPCRW